MHTKQFTAIECDNRGIDTMNIFCGSVIIYIIPIQNALCIPINLRHYHGELVTGSMAKTLR